MSKSRTRPATRDLVSIETIERQIFVLRGHRVMLDRDLAELYGVELKRLNEQVKRNRDRFPDDFMFWLTLEEGKAVILSRSQVATLKRGENIKYQPHAFTEHGAVMLANVLRSPVALPCEHPGGPGGIRTPYKKKGDGRDRNRQVSRLRSTE